jgi:hypothetical protein
MALQSAGIGFARDGDPHIQAAPDNPVTLEIAGEGIKSISR